jgi:recombination endonuclease VII
MPYVDPEKARECYRRCNAAYYQRNKTRKNAQSKSNYRANFISGSYADRDSLRMYGIDLASRSAMFAAQGFCCIVCKSSHPKWKNGWCLDHDHTKKKGDEGFVRGILCYPCNQAASKHHTPQSLRALADYLEKHHG